MKNGNRDWVDKVRLQIGLVQLAAGKPDQAREAFEAIERDSAQSPLAPEARLHRAEALARLGRTEEAENLLRPLASAEGGIAAQASYALAGLLLDRKRPDEALAAYDNTLKRFPDTPLTPLLWYGSGVAAQAAGKLDDARQRFLKVAEKYPKDEWADDALLHALELTQKAGENTQARALAVTFAKRFPDSPLCPNALLIEAQAALASQDAKAAIALLEPMLTDAKLDPALASSARLALGVAYRERAARQGASDPRRHGKSLARCSVHRGRRPL